MKNFYAKQIDLYCNKIEGLHDDIKNESNSEIRINKIMEAGRLLRAAFEMDTKHRFSYN